jgi:excisionase family DNA binding protein
MTVDEVARLLRVSTATVYLLAKRGEIAAFKTGNSWRFTSEAVKEFMKGVMPIDDEPEQS